MAENKRCHGPAWMWLDESISYATDQQCMEAILDTPACLKTMMKYNPARCNAVSLTPSFISVYNGASKSHSFIFAYQSFIRLAAWIQTL